MVYSIRWVYQIYMFWLFVKVLCKLYIMFHPTYSLYISYRLLIHFYIDVFLCVIYLQLVIKIFCTLNIKFHPTYRLYMSYRLLTYFYIDVFLCILYLHSLSLQNVLENILHYENQREIYVIFKIYKVYMDTHTCLLCTNDCWWNRF